VLEIVNIHIAEITMHAGIVKLEAPRSL